MNKCRKGLITQFLNFATFASIPVFVLLPLCLLSISPVRAALQPIDGFYGSPYRVETSNGPYGWDATIPGALEIWFDSYSIKW